MEITLNKKVYKSTGCFEKQHIEEYCNLQIYPLVGIIEHEIAILHECAKYIANPRIFHYCQKNEVDDFFHSMNKYPHGNTLLSRVDDGYRGSLGLVEGVVIIAPNSSILKSEYPTFYKLSPNRFIYIRSTKIPKTIHTFNNLLKYTMIIKDGGPLLEQVLRENIPFMDSWCILDTGSTDGTQDVILNTLKDIPGKLYEEPFINFRDSRNRCLELAGTDTKFIVMLDDTYVIRESKPGAFREFLTVTRGDQFSDSYSLLIQSHDTEYYSNRIIKSENNLRYIYTIHEVIQEHDNINVTVPKNVAYVFDYRADYMEKRTTDRKQFDLQLLFKEYEDNPDDPRALYYIAQTYGCIGDEEKKAEYFEKRINHPVQGYVQEKIDALFELARTYNFKLNKPWDIVEPLYMKAWELDKNRPDSIYFIAIHWYLEHNFVLAHKYFKLAYQIGYPLNSQYSLKPTLTFHYTPKFLTEVCYYQKDYQLGFESAEFYIRNNPNQPNYQVNQWYNIHKHCSKVSLKEPLITDKCFVIVADGGWKPWSGKDINEVGVGGSETWVIETARNIPSEYTVVVFCKCNEVSVFEGVMYRPIDQYESWLSTHSIEYCMISRYTQYIPCTLLNPTIKKVGVIFHDTFMEETIIPIDDRLHFFCLTDFHTNMFVSMFPQFEKKTNTLNYGITEPEHQKYSKKPNSFIYSSFPNRGLLKVLELWPSILEALPDAELDVFCDLEHSWSNQNYPEYMSKVKELIHQPGIKNHGWVAKKVLRYYWSQSEYWLYPCNFVETFCMTALEAALYKVKVISNNLGALAETVGDRGKIIQDNWTDQDYINALHEDYTQLIEKNYKWAKSLTWKGQTSLLLKILESQNENLEYSDMLNWTVDCPTGSKQPFVDILKQIPVDSNILEIGTFTGTSIIKMLELVPMATATVIDPWENYVETVGEFRSPTENMDSTFEIFHKNVKSKGMTDRIEVIRKQSVDGLLELFARSAQFDFIYIDGSHRCMDVFLDAELSWRLLRKGGILGFDDLHFNQSVVLESPWEAIQYFLKKYSDQIRVLSEGYRLFIEKI